MPSLSDGGERLAVWPQAHADRVRHCLHGLLDGGFHRAGFVLGDARLLGAARGPVPLAEVPGHGRAAPEPRQELPGTERRAGAPGVAMHSAPHHRVRLLNGARLDEVLEDKEVVVVDERDGARGASLYRPPNVFLGVSVLADDPSALRALGVDLEGVRGALHAVVADDTLRLVDEDRARVWRSRVAPDAPPHRLALLLWLLFLALLRLLSRGGCFVPEVWPPHVNVEALRVPHPRAPLCASATSARLVLLQLLVVGSPLGVIAEGLVSCHDEARQLLGVAAKHIGVHNLHHATVGTSYLVRLGSEPRQAQQGVVVRGCP
mmetsp:Transcript_91033/g.241774  ORF Transcript_91033/g.241774 Transcript_91033/m.241774 type:complete len:319 (-) Transcript_91033:269-1225(-)